VKDLRRNARPWAAALAVTSLCATAFGAVWTPARAGGERVTPAGEAVVVLSEQFLSAVVEAVAAEPEGASFPLGRGGTNGEGKCAGLVTLVPEAEGVRTGVRFRDGRVTAPVAFRGTYEAPLLGCLNFEGWADASFDLYFDAERQTLFARVTVRDLKLKNVPTAFSGGVTGLVQDAIDARVNPVRVLRAEQLGAPLPLSRGAGLRLRARDVRHEVVGKELRLRIAYDIIGR
jgi:hypothetical protein